MIADDHPMFREAVVHEACDLGAMQALIHDAGEVDTLILDLRFPGLTCMSQLAELRQQLWRTTLIVVSMVDDPALIEHVMALGPHMDVTHEY
jgi:DNA-binding NarL/FixJ family response regulator